MNNFCPSALLLLLIATGIASGNDLPPSANAAIERILDRAGDKTMEQIHFEVDKVVSGLDKEFQQKHEAWKQRVERDEKQRMTRIRDVLPNLSPRAQQRLIRIVLVQQNNKYTPSEKNAILKQIAVNLDSSIRNELMSNLSPEDLFTMIY